MREPGEKGINFQIKPFWGGRALCVLGREMEMLGHRKGLGCNAGRRCLAGNLQKTMQKPRVRMDIRAEIRDQPSQNHPRTPGCDGFEDRTQGSTGIFKAQHLLCVHHPAPHVHQLKAAAAALL